jgi:outer membrane protein
VKQVLLLLLLALPVSCTAQDGAAALPPAPVAHAVLLHSSGMLLVSAQSASGPQKNPLLEPGVPSTPITRSAAESMALKNNPSITASRLMALAAGQVTRQTQSAELPQINSYMTAEKAEDAARIGAGSLTSSRVYTHAGTGGTH